MPNLNIEIDQDLLRAIRVKAASEDMTRRDWIVERLENAVTEEPNKDQIERSQS